MKAHKFYIVLVIFALGIVLSSFENYNAQKVKMPYQAAGLTKEMAAVHLLSRFTFGIKQGDVDEVVKMGLEKWFSQQLSGDLKDAKLDTALSKYDAINLSNAQVEELFPRNFIVVRNAIKDGYLNKDSVNANDRKKYRQTIAVYMQVKGLRPEQELFRQLISQKILRATYTQNQLREVMTDFWFNHFNVAINKPQCASFIPSYERDVIRPNVFEHFDKLLIATAKSPAMLLYLDNATSSGNNDPDNNEMGSQILIGKRLQNRMAQQKAKGKKNGLNENYAREVMELHTLGVDGGYTQSDVTDAAKILTGWTVGPMGQGGYGGNASKLLTTIGEENLEKKGYLLDGDFFFAVNKHDNGEKTVLGKRFVAGGGYQEGIELLEMLAKHQSTAKFISKKIAIRFVSDQPSKSLIDKMAKTFLATNGDIKAVLITMVNSPEFWNKEALREKTKSPFELAISAVRAVDAKISLPFQLNSWITKMGQQIYYYQAPTGFPDRGQYWINTGALLNRMNFGLAMATQKIPGISFSLLAMTNNHEPESALAALKTYGTMLLPQRDLTKTYERLKPMIASQNLGEKVAKAAEQHRALGGNMQADTLSNQRPTLQTQNLSKPDAAMLAQVVGVIIGSPEYQKR
jgi:uncharacterized protein (DUF1800 family)